MLDFSKGQAVGSSKRLDFLVFLDKEKIKAADPVSQPLRK